MDLPSNLKDIGFSLCDVEITDFASYYHIKKRCFEKYVNQYYGVWSDTVQIKMNEKAFYDAIKETCFQKLLLNGSEVGFFSFDIKADKIDGVAIQMLENAQKKGVGSFFLNHIVSLSNEQKKPVFLKVFVSNPAQELYKRFGFTVYDQTDSHYMLRYEPEK